ncbi:MAG: DUF302 domain-containing protein [Dongiaceae bacterium]
MTGFRKGFVAILMVAGLAVAPATGPAIAQTFDDTTAAELERGIVKMPSAFSVAETIDRLEGLLVANGTTVFSRIDHAANAQGVGMELAPMQLLVFGNPKVGTPALQADPLTGLDLPLKALAFQDQSGAVFLAYNDPVWFAERHFIPPDHPGIQNVAAALDQLARAATTP